MGFLALSLSFVSITLIINGVGRLRGVDAKSIAFFNVFTGLLLFIGNTIAITRAATNLDYNNATAGFLFSVTYLLIAAMNVLKIDARVFGWFSLWAAIFAVFSACTLFGVINWLAVLWLAWAILWLSGTIEINWKVKWGNVGAYIIILEGILATGLPAFLIWYYGL